LKYCIEKSSFGKYSKKKFSLQVLISDDVFTMVTLPLKDFKPYYRGVEILDGEPLDTTNITMFEFQIYGGIYLPIKQRGVSALEIETVTVSS